MKQGSHAVLGEITHVQGCWQARECTDPFISVTLAHRRAKGGGEGEGGSGRRGVVGGERPPARLSAAQGGGERQLTLGSLADQTRIKTAPS